MATDYKTYLNDLDESLKGLIEAAPGPMGAYTGLVREAGKSGALDRKTKELMALAIAVSTHCEGCIVHHARVAMRLKASRDEVLETIAVAVQMGGGPSTVYGAMALDAFDQLQG